MPLFISTDAHYIILLEMHIQLSSVDYAGVSSKIEIEYYDHPTDVMYRVRLGKKETITTLTY